MDSQNLNAQSRRYNGTAPPIQVQSSFSSSRGPVEQQVVSSQYASSFDGRNLDPSHGSSAAAYSSSTYLGQAQPSQYNTTSTTRSTSSGTGIPSPYSVYAATSQQSPSSGSAASHLSWPILTPIDGSSQNVPRSLHQPPLTYAASANNENVRQEGWQRQHSGFPGRGQTRPPRRPRANTTTSSTLTAAAGRLSIQQPGAEADSSNRSPTRSNHDSRRGRGNGYGGTGQTSRPTSGPQSPPFTTLEEGYKKRRGKFYEVGRVFHMVLDQPHGEEFDEKSSWTFNTFGQAIHTKPRRFVVVRQELQSCLVVPLTTYSGRGVAKEKVTKSNHCVAYSGATVPQPKQEELPVQGELPMQTTPIKIDPDDRLDKLDYMTRIDFASPRRVEHYAVVKNYGKVNPHSKVALVTQFQNVMRPSHRARTIPSTIPTQLLSARSKYLQAYHALVNFGWSRERAAEFVNVNIRAEERQALTTSSSAAAVSGGSGTDYGSQSEDET